MRWPNRKPHVLTAGMRRAQRGLAAFVPSIDWARFDRRSVGPEIVVTDAEGSTVGEDRMARFACASRDQAVVYLLGRDRLDARGMLRRDGPPFRLAVSVPGLDAGRYRVSCWDTVAGRNVAPPTEQDGATPFVLPAFDGDAAVAIRRCGD